LLYLCTVNQDYETDTTDTQIKSKISRVPRAYMRYARKYINYLLYLLSVTYQSVNLSTELFSLLH